MKPRVLWIEDSARLELRNLVGPIYFEGKYDFRLAEDVTSAMNLLLAEQFDAVIVDIRLPPGIDHRWQELYEKSGSNKVQAELGLKLLQWLLRADPTVYPSPPPTWVKPERIGVFSVESTQAIGATLKRMGIPVYQQKIAGLPDTVLIEMINRILEQGK